jgi:hypothetical protein
MLTADYKFSPDYLELKGLNVNNNFIVGSNGNVTMRGNISMTGGSIAWGNINETGSAAYQTANNAYSLAGDAYYEAAAAASNVARLANGQYSGTFINGKVLVSPTIMTNLLEITTPGGNSGGKSGLVLKGYWGNTLHDMFEVTYYEGDAAYVAIQSPVGAYAHWRFSNSYFYGNIHFEGADVTGIDATFG